MPEIHVINGQPRECSDAITARGLTAEWLADPEATEKKIAEILADEAAARHANLTRPKHETQVVLEADTTSGSIPRPRRARPASE